MIEEKNKQVIEIPLEDIIPNRFQPRLTFDEKELQELANSILRYGVIQPIVVRKLGDKFEIVAGERRYKASTLAGLSKIPAIVMETDDNTSAEIALLENLQRKNLTVIEEAQSYKKLMDRGFTQDDIAAKLGVSQSAIANKVRLLNLPNEVQDALLYNRISERHARCLLTLKDPDLQKNLLNKIVNERLTVKQTEDEINFINNKDKIMNEAMPIDIGRFLNPETRVAPVENVENLETNNEIDELLKVESSSVSEPDTVETLPVMDVPTEIETLDFKIPDVIDIEESETPISEKIDETVSLNPFQEEVSIENPFKDLIDKLDDNRNGQNVNESSVVTDLPEINMEIRTSDELIDRPVEIMDEILDNKIIEEVKSEKVDEQSTVNSAINMNDSDISLPRIINKVRSFARDMDEDSDRITMEEIDLPDSYQIIINISKN